jgi:FkbH-like protein
MTDLRALTEPGFDDVPALVDAGIALAGAPAPPDARPLRIGIAATFTAEVVVPALRVHLMAAGIAPEFYVAPFDQLLLELGTPESGLAAFAPDVTLCLLHERAFLPQDWDRTDPAAAAAVLRDRLSTLEHALAGYAERVPSSVLLHTVPLPVDEYRTVIGHRCRAILGRVWRELNSALLELADRLPAVYAVDLELLLTDHPGPLRDERLYQFASMAWAPLVEARYVREAAGFCRAVAGVSKKVLALDLDNTLWGGVVGDDGPAGIQLGSLYPGNCYTRLQRTAQALRKQGVLLVLCSKNDATTVDTVLTDHPDMVLRTRDFVAKAVNWERKDENLRHVTQELNLNLDSVVFVDDSRFEIELVRRSLPQVEVVHLTGDPAEFVHSLLDKGFFDVLTTTATDVERTELYRARVDRSRLAATFTSAQDYLRELALRVAVRPADEYALPRLVQLALRTNQFITAGRAHTEAQSRAMVSSADHLLLGFSVEDRFGSEGIVGGVWIAKAEQAWLIENFVMSCRVFSRGVEYAVLQHVIDLAADAGIPTLEATVRRTARNGPAARFYPEAGFAVVAESADVVSYAVPLRPRPAVGPDWIMVNNPRESSRA